MKQRRTEMLCVHKRYNEYNILSGNVSLFLVILRKAQQTFNGSQCLNAVIPPPTYLPCLPHSPLREGQLRMPQLRNSVMCVVTQSVSKPVLYLASHELDLSVLWRVVRQNLCTVEGCERWRRSNAPLKLAGLARGQSLRRFVAQLSPLRILPPRQGNAYFQVEHA